VPLFRQLSPISRSMPGGRQRRDTMKKPSVLKVRKILYVIHERDPAPDTCRRSIPRWTVMSQFGCSTAAVHHRHGMVDQALHEYAAALSAARHANRSRRLIKCAKDSGHYHRDRGCIGAILFRLAGELPTCKRGRSLGPWLRPARFSVCASRWCDLLFKYRI
jgi:hypothetical protein